MAGRRGIGAVLGVAVALTLAVYAGRPHVFTADDWVWLRNAHFGGALSAGGCWQLRTRPGAWAIYAVVFGLVGPHPAIIFGIQALLAAGSAAFLFALGRRWITPPVAAAVALTWVVLPNHTSLLMWPSTINIIAALLLLLVGFNLVADDHVASGAVLVVAAALTYEVTLPIGLLGIAIISVLRRWTWTTRIVAVALPTLAGLYTLAVTPKTLGLPFAQPQAVLSSQFVTGLGLRSDLGGRAFLVLFGLASVALVIGPPRMRWMIVTGLVTVTAGLLPVVKQPTDFLGTDDRFNVVASVGVAIIVVGTIAGLARRRGIAALAVAWPALTVLGFLSVGRIAPAYEWASSQVRSAATSGQRIVDRPQRTDMGVSGAGASWSVTAAAELLRDPHAVVCVPIHGMPYPDWPNCPDGASGNP